MVISNWHIGREIVEYMQRGKPRAEYGEEVIEDLSKQLRSRVGRGYSARNLWYFRDFYVTYRERPASIRPEGFRTSLAQIRSRSTLPRFCTRLALSGRCAYMVSSTPIARTCPGTASTCFSKRVRSGGSSGHRRVGEAA